MKTTTIEEIKDFVVSAEKAEKAGKLLEVVKTTKFVNKEDPTDSFTSLEEAFEKGLNLADYTKTSYSSGIKIDLDQFITKSEIDVLGRFIDIISKLSGKASTDVINETGEEKTDEKEYKRLSNSLNNKLSKARKENNVLDVEKYEAQRTELNLKYGKTSRKK